MNSREKNAIENLIIVARYIQDESIMTREDEALLEKSIALCEELIGREVPLEKPIVLSDSRDMNVDDLISALKRRKNLD